MTSFGLLPTGFNRKRYADIIADKEERARALFGESVNLQENSPLGLFIRLNAWEEARLWQIVEEVYYSRFIDTAEGESLDLLVSHIGMTRTPAVKATGEITISGTDGVIVPEGFVVQTVDGCQFVTTEEVTISGETAIAPIEAVVAGAAGNVPAYTITQIVNPLPGVSTVTNESPTTGGKDRESDTDLRMRYKRSVALPGTATAASIEARLLSLDTVEDAYVRENDTNTTVDGLPPKSVNALVLGGDDSEIAQVIFETKSAGIQAYGGTVVEVIDSHGNIHQIGFDRPTEITIYYSVGLNVDVKEFPSDGISQVTDAIVQYTNSLSLGDDCIYTRVIATIQQVPGVLDIPTLFMDTVSPPESTGNISIAFNELARTSAENIQVEVVT
ncbi:MAG: baseplate J/gp47 family protein [Deltaproteobacteria bacterium]|nr:baseplate J/gp47 family protein [Deltaproteobacteria bacterium]